jgi:DNA-binding NtrC family response regulator
MKQPASILIVDDNPALLHTFNLILRRKGYRIDIAADGEMAIEKFRNGNFDLVLMDIVMPRMNGIQAFRKMREINPDTKVILMSAYQESQLTDGDASEGPFGSIPKPVAVARLMDLIGAATGDPLVLIVDDDADFLRTLQAGLSLQGIKVEIATNGLQAVKLAHERCFQIALIDVKMPSMNGFEVRQLLKECNSQTVTIMMTGYREEVEPLIAETDPNLHCLFKPVGIPEVVKVIDEMAGSEHHERI